MNIDQAARGRSRSAADAGLPVVDEHSGTRERVKQAVSEHGPITAGELATLVGLTPAAVRRHLDSLSEAGLLDERERAGQRGRGRPARAYVLSEAGHSELREDYDTLAADLLQFLSTQLGPGAVEAFARQRADDVVARVRPQVEAAGSSTADRAQALAEALHGQGYAASARPVTPSRPTAGIQLCQGHCPVRDIAAQYPQLCEAELEAFSEVLGVHVQRLASLAQGDHVCTTFIPVTQLSDRPPTSGGVPESTDHEQSDPSRARANQKESR